MMYEPQCSLYNDTDNDDKTYDLMWGVPVFRPVEKGTHIYSKEKPGKNHDRCKHHGSDMEPDPSKDPSTNYTKRIKEHKDAPHKQRMEELEVVGGCVGAPDRSRTRHRGRCVWNTARAGGLDHVHCEFTMITMKTNASGLRVALK